jgi:hypothetical protein
MKFGQTNMNPYVRIRKVHVCSVCTRVYIFIICTFIPNIVYNIHTVIRFVSICAKFGVCTVVHGSKWDTCYSYNMHFAREGEKCQI